MKTAVSSSSNRCEWSTGALTVADSPPKIGTVWPNLQLAGEIGKVSGYSKTGQVFCFFSKHDLPVAITQKWTEHSQTSLFCLNLSLPITCHMLWRTFWKKGINAVWPKPPGDHTRSQTTWAFTGTSQVAGSGQTPSLMSEGRRRMLGAWQQDRHSQIRL